MEAARDGKVGAVRHFLRVEPNSHEKTDADGRGLRTGAMGRPEGWTTDV